MSRAEINALRTIDDLDVDDVLRLMYELQQAINVAVEDMRQHRARVENLTALMLEQRKHAASPQGALESVGRAKSLFKGKAVVRAS